MDNTLLTEINKEINLKEEFVAWLGIALEDVAQEILDEALGSRALGMAGMGHENQESAARARAGEREWVRDIAAKTERPGAEVQPRAPSERGVQPGDFVVVGGKPVKVVDTKTMFGNTEFAYLQGVQKPVLTDRLNLHKKVGKINIYSAGN